MSDTRRRLCNYNWRNYKLTEKHQSNLSGARKRGWTSTTKKFGFCNYGRNSKCNLQKKIEHLKLEEDLNC